MGQLWSIFFPKRSHSHPNISSKARRHYREYFGSGSLGESRDRSQNGVYWSEAQRQGPISSEELDRQLYHVHPGHKGGKRTRKHTRNSNSTLKRSTRKQKRA